MSIGVCSACVSVCGVGFSKRPHRCCDRRRRLCSPFCGAGLLLCVLCGIRPSSLLRLPPDALHYSALILFVVVDANSLSLLRRGVAVDLPHLLAVLSPPLSRGLLLVVSCRRQTGVWGQVGYRVISCGNIWSESISDGYSTATLGGNRLGTASSWTTLVGGGGGGGDRDSAVLGHGGE